MDYLDWRPIATHPNATHLDLLARDGLIWIGAKLPQTLPAYRIPLPASGDPVNESREVIAAIFHEPWPAEPHPLATTTSGADIWRLDGIEAGVVLKAGAGCIGYLYPCTPDGSFLVLADYRQVTAAELLYRDPPPAPATAPAKPRRAPSKKPGLYRSITAKVVAARAARGSLPRHDELAREVFEELSRLAPVSRDRVFWLVAEAYRDLGEGDKVRGVRKTTL